MAGRRALGAEVAATREAGARSGPALGLVDERPQARTRQLAVGRGALQTAHAVCNGTAARELGVPKRRDLLEGEEDSTDGCTEGRCYTGGGTTGDKICGVF